MEQILDLDGRELKLIVPRSSDAVMDFYIEAGDLSCSVLVHNSTANRYPSGQQQIKQ